MITGWSHRCSFGCGFVAEPQDGVQPWFITKPKAVSAFVGQHVLLSCAVAGDPFPEYTWTRAHLSRPLTSGGDYELLQKEDVVSLLIRSNIYSYRRFILDSQGSVRLNPPPSSSSSSLGGLKNITLETT